MKKHPRQTRITTTSNQPQHDLEPTHTHTQATQERTRTEPATIVEENDLAEAFGPLDAGFVAAYAADVDDEEAAVAAAATAEGALLPPLLADVDAPDDDIADNEANEGAAALEEQEQPM